MQLRPHQEKAIEMLKQSLRTGHKRPLLAAPTAFGKTITAAYIAKKAVAKGKRVVFIADRVKLVNQALEAMDVHGIDAGVIQADHWRTDYSKPVQIASWQTLAKKIEKHGTQAFPFDLAIVDECFPAGTLIDTPSGKKPIELVRCGDTVYNACGVGNVMSASAKYSESIVEVSFNDGSKIRCTENHPIFTGTGWTKAGELALRQRVIRIEDMPSLWESVWSKDCIGKSGSFRGGLEQKENLLKVLLEEVGESYAQQREQGKNASDIDKYRAQAESYWRKWQGNNKASEAFNEPSREWVDCGVCSSNWDQGVEWQEATAPLQNRYCESRKDDCDRGGWNESLLSKEARAGQTEDGSFDVLRVEGVQVIERGCTVYNIGVSGHPSYFANGVLVHNCHTIYKSMTDIMDQLNLIPFIGLSATPYTKGLGLVWDDLLVPVTPRELLAEGYLCPADYYGGHKISVEGVKSRTVNGVTDYDPNALAEAVEGDTQLVGGVIDNWLKHAKGRQTVAFTPSIAHSKQLVREFQEAGISAEHVDGYMDHEERDDIIEAHNNGEFTILSCSRLLNTGWDSPITSCIIDCFPTRSISTYVQRIGRGLRTAEGKTECIVLDHAQNVSRFGFAEDWYPTKLDDGSDKYNERKLTNKDEEKTEPKVRDCPQCYREFIGIRCSCGYEIPIKEQIETTQEELKKLEKAEAKIATKEQKISFYAQLKNYAHQKNYNPSWADHKYREKFGTWYGYGNKHNLPMENVTPEVQSWITSRQIAWAKSKENAA